MNQNVKNLIQKLGEAIHESVSESENIAGVVKNIREEGFDVLLMLEATIGLNQVDGGGATGDDAADADSQLAHGPFTSRDLNFLKSLRITLPDYDGDKLSASDAKLIDITVDDEDDQSSESPADPTAEA
jgi:hypothetical protein